VSELEVKTGEGRRNAVESVSSVLCLWLFGFD
jgi:hypothetical protein